MRAKEWGVLRQWFVFVCLLKWLHTPDHLHRDRAVFVASTPPPATAERNNICIYRMDSIFASQSQEIFECGKQKKYTHAKLWGFSRCEGMPEAKRKKHEGAKKRQIMHIERKQTNNTINAVRKEEIIVFFGVILLAISLPTHFFCLCVVSAFFLFFPSQSDYSELVKTTS